MLNRRRSDTRMKLLSVCTYVYSQYLCLISQRDGIREGYSD